MSDDYEEFEDEEEDDGMIYLDAAPVTKYTFFAFFFTVIIGILRTLIEATCNLANSITGEEVYKDQKRVFENEARLQMETIWNEDGS